MGNVWGKKIKLAIFGESHGSAIGISIDGLSPGFPIDWAMIEAEMRRRAPGNSALTTPRKERDAFEILSGVYQEKTTGTPLCAIIRNENTRSSDYNADILRPGHADLTALYKYKGFSDPRGGGHFSGRLTAPLVFAGAIAKQILHAQGIEVGARIARIAGISDAPMPPESMLETSRKAFPVFDDDAGQRMRDAVLAAKGQADSVGGIVECAALGVPRGWGDPFFDSLESRISSMMFSIPAVKGIEFGDGFALSDMTGSEANDPLSISDGEIALQSNHNGGINGGLSNGEPIVFRVAIKPTPTVGKTQTTVDHVKREMVSVVFGGRHDPCIVPRAVPVVEAAMALCLLDCE